ncbi:LbetaH domain-containing protein [Ferruginibacter sp.]
MITSLNIQELADYTSRQLNHFFPDNNTVDLNQYRQPLELALNRLEHCYQHCTLKHYNNGENTFFNHLYSDHYVMYLWYLANSIWKEKGDKNTCNKLYYLNKSLNGLDCMYDTALPEIFLLFHSVGTMLGKASYNDFFIALHGCTVGSHNGIYPVFGKGVSLTANSSVIGNCQIGDRVSVGVRTCVFNSDIENDHTVYLDKKNGSMNIRAAGANYAQQFFNVNLASL